jgi:hypothetical protein
MAAELTLDKQHAETRGQVRHVLIVRSGVARAFGTLGVFAAAIFLGAGIYLLQDALTDPLRAEAVGLVAGAFVIALATILIYFIFAPRAKLQGMKSRRRARYQVRRPDIVISGTASERLKESSKDMPIPV